jgi:hypothetical protein
LTPHRRFGIVARNLRLRGRCAPWVRSAIVTVS